MTSSNVTAEMQSMVGREILRRVSFPISSSDVRRWALAVYYPERPPEWFLSQTEPAVPEEFNPFAWMCASTASPTDVSYSSNDPGRIEKTLGVEPPPLTHMLNGGLSVTYERPLACGDVIESVSRLKTYFEREGRLGLMLFTVSEDTWTNQDGQATKRTESTVIRY